MSTYKNDKVETFKILVIEKTKLLTEDQNQVAENVKVIDPCLPGNPWRLLEVYSLSVLMRILCD
jgi:hypothetical protein